MKPTVVFISSILAVIAVVALLMMFPKPMLFVVLGFFVVVGIHDIFQKKHSILRNFPLIGHLRFLSGGVGSEIRQYFVESDTDGKLLNRINGHTFIHVQNFKIQIILLERSMIYKQKELSGQSILFIQVNIWMKHQEFILEEKNAHSHIMQAL